MFCPRCPAPPRPAALQLSCISFLSCLVTLWTTTLNWKYGKNIKKSSCTPLSISMIITADVTVSINLSILSHKVTRPNSNPKYLVSRHKTCKTFFFHSVTSENIMKVLHTEKEIYVFHNYEFVNMKQLWVGLQAPHFCLWIWERVIIFIPHYHSNKHSFRSSHFNLTNHNATILLQPLVLSHNSRKSRKKQEKFKLLSNTPTCAPPRSAPAQPSPTLWFHKSPSWGIPGSNLESQSLSSQPSRPVPIQAVIRRSCGDLGGQHWTHLAFTSTLNKHSQRISFSKSPCCCCSGRCFCCFCSSRVWRVCCGSCDVTCLSARGQ